MRSFLVLLVLLAACSGGAREFGVGGESTGSIPPPETELAAADEPWVDFEARWICDLERSTYDDPADVEAALAERLDEESIDPGEYAEFQGRLDSDTELARHVQAAVVARCG